MKIKPIGPSADFLKRKAKFVKRESGISHIESLNRVAVGHGFESWIEFIKQTHTVPIKKLVLSRPAVPGQLVLNYYNVWNGDVIGQHPNAKMPPSQHKKVGELLQDISGIVQYHKRARNMMYDIIATMDTWLGCEYKEADMGNEEFNSIYYGRNKTSLQAPPTLRQQQKYKRWLRDAKNIIDQHYHDCEPLTQLHEKFESAHKMLENWPKKIKIPVFNKTKKQLLAGTFVRLTGTKQIGVVFHHPYGGESVVGYADGGTFHRGRNEVTLVRKKIALADFQPMRLSFPYGIWICENGREVLFNRDYTPIWERIQGGITEYINPESQISYISTEFYYDDATAPYYGNLITQQLCQSVLDEWEVNQRKSKVMELFPIAVATGNTKLLSPKGTS